jgi:hypothetical protein
MITKKQKLINGPVIAMRLEGNINGIDKVFYFFGDNHFSLDYETKCSSFDAEDFIQYFRKTMKNTDKNINYDFFLEINDDDPSDENDEKKNIYILEIRKFFNYKKHYLSEIKNNLRLYYADIRNYFDNSWNYYLELENFTNKLYNADVNDVIVNQLKNILFELNKMVELTTNILLNNINNNNKNIYEEDEYYKKNKYYSEKILNKYNNKNIRDILLDKTFLLHEIKKNVNFIKESSLEAENQLESLNELIKKYDRKKYNTEYGIDFMTNAKKILEIINILNNIQYKYIYLSCYIMDLYLLRKILDKNYITRGIMYTGYFHLFNYVYILVNNFKFKITHTTNKDVTIENIYDIIKNEYSDDLFNQIMPNKLIQCIDVTNFPEKFT